MWLVARVTANETPSPTALFETPRFPPSVTAPDRPRAVRGRGRGKPDPAPRTRRTEIDRCEPLFSTWEIFPTRAWWPVRRYELPSPWRSLGGRVDRGFSGGGELKCGDDLKLVVLGYFDGWIQTVRYTHTAVAAAFLLIVGSRPSSSWAAMQEQGVGKTSTAAAWNKF